ALWTIKCAPGTLDDAFDGAAASDAGLAGAVIDLQALFVEFLDLRRGAEIKETVTKDRTRIIHPNRAAAFDGTGKCFTKGLPQALDLRQFQSTRGQSWRNARSKERFDRVNVPDAGHQLLIE